MDSGGHSEPSGTSPEACAIQRLPRRILRKIVVQPYGSGWVAMIVGFDPRFFTPIISPEVSSRGEALRCAEALARQTGLPLITVETLTVRSGPGEAA